MASFFNRKPTSSEDPSIILPSPKKRRRPSWLFFNPVYALCGLLFWGGAYGLYKLAEHFDDRRISNEKEAARLQKENNWGDTKDRKAFVAGRKARVKKDLNVLTRVDEKNPGYTPLAKGTEGLLDYVGSDGEVFFLVLREGVPGEKIKIFVITAADLELVEGAAPSSKQEKGQRKVEPKKTGTDQRSQLQPDGPVRPGGLAAGGGGFRNNGFFRNKTYT